MAGGEAQAKHIWDLLMQRLPQDLQDLEQARSQGDREQLRRVVHSLRGSATYCATPDLLETACALDQAAAQGENGLEQTVPGTKLRSLEDRSDRKTQTL